MEIVVKPKWQVYQHTVASITFGDVYKLKGVVNSDIYMKVFPSHAMFKSQMINEVINRGDFFVINLTTNCITIHSGSKEVEIISAAITIS